ncbi:MAG: DUF448 domain-containing protein [Fimbriimonadaceae bacterium]|nr:DUF448 domain-containing protein [Fimbriimonadaceae bacterium]
MLRLRLAPGREPTLGPAPGRSAYCCDTPECREGLTARGRLARAWRRPVDEGLLRAVRQVMECQQR